MSPCTKLGLVISGGTKFPRKLEDDPPGEARNQRRRTRGMFVNPSQIEGCTATCNEETSLGARMLLTGDLVCKKTCFRLPISTYTEQTGRCFGESISYFAVLSGYKSTHYLVFCVPKNCLHTYHTMIYNVTRKIS